MRKIFFASLIIFNVSLFSNDSEIIQKINNVLPDGLKVISVQDSEINGIMIVDIGDLQPLYVSEDGNHFFFGDLYQVDRSEIENLTEVHKNFKRKDLLDKALTNDDFISFRSNNQKHEIVVFTGAFHGRSLLNITAGDSEFQKTGFGPLLKGFKRARFNNLKSAKKAVTSKTAAIFIEPIQGESGVIRAENPFLMGLRKLADDNECLLIFDEVQSGIGRTGSLMAYMGYGVKPDISTLAKGLGGGMPIGATLTTSKISKAFQPGTHGSTFGGNPLACEVAKKVVEIVSTQKVLKGVMKKTISFHEKLNHLSEKFNIFEDIRSAGLWICCDFKRIKAKDFIDASYKKGLILVQAAGEKTIRIAPSLIISEKEIEEGFKRFEMAVKAIK